MALHQLRDALAAPRAREFAFGNEDFDALRKLVKDLTGINLSDQKRELVYGRLARRLRALELSTFREYRERTDSGLGEPERVVDPDPVSSKRLARLAHSALHTIEDHFFTTSR